MQIALVGLYLAAIVAANLTTAEFGPEWSVVNAFLFIGLDLVARDRLHDLWARHRALKMGGLIAAGSLLSYWINADAKTIAVASAVAFGAATTVDYLIYSMLRARGWRWVERVNASNVPSAGVDSVVFPALAFPGPLSFVIVFGQFAAKVGGGAVWSLVLQSRRDRAPFYVVPGSSRRVWEES